MTDDLIGSSTEKGTDAIVVLRMQGEDTLIVLTLRVNTNGVGAPSTEDDLEQLYRSLRRDLHYNGDLVRNIIIDCAVELSPKTAVYATLVGLLNTDDQDFTTDLIQSANEQFNVVLAAGDKNRARLLLRFFAALVVANVLHASSVLAALLSVVDAASAIASAGGGGDSGRLWQPYTDYLVYAALMALPWGGAELAESAPSDLERLFGGVEAYMAARPRASQPALRPFLRPKDADDIPAQSDSGGASFLGQVWEAVQELRSGGKWSVDAIRQVAPAFEAKLAAGQPHDLPALTVPPTPPGVSGTAAPMEAAASVLELFPPRGIIRLLPAEHTELGTLKVERLVAEEYILDTIHFFEADRVECARRLAKGLQLPGKHESLLAEMLFSQMLRVPQPQLKPLAYSTLMVDVCKLMATFPRSMSACVRECFARMDVMDPELRMRLADWLAYHLSNFEFMWPWDKWKHVLDMPPHNSQRRFVVATLSKLVRLSYRSRIQSVIPPAFVPLLAADNDVLPLPGPPELAPDADVDGAHEDERDAETVRAYQLLQMVRHKVVSEGVLEWVEEEQLRQELGGGLGVLRMLLRGYLVAGAKSFTHMITALERYCTTLQALLHETGHEARSPASTSFVCNNSGGILQGEVALVDVTAKVWANAPQRAAQVIDRLMALRLVSGAAIVAWVFGCPGVRTLADELSTGLAWEVFYNAVNKMLARTQDARDDLSEAQAESDAAGARAREAAEAFSRAGEGEDTPQDLAERLAQEEAAAGSVLAETQAQVEGRQADLDEAVQLQEALLLQVFTNFRDILLEGHAELGASAAEPASGEEPDPSAIGATEQQDAKHAWYAFMLATLQSFTRRYYKAVASIAGQVEDDLFQGDAVPEDVRTAIVESLHL
ncbi:ARM repeat-containing protein [Coccomyxa subellipsoidea C-169]|uniref:ARM repeat-containing protein n=1 Tax=Coccomyxa subellipsoidea (strain C-169) TaxID=574566 RepID=I0Z3N8_COCSC|nr:ARM repeat-containing protein [Coccomyxa subellipsoidea C-169]EIE25257.1 ARM repeat-containing protein [Coccomyxa subellipsoidea C-169]|eukprot:XP_005649801.1 ARM repeat-containing protein [Coccomyxa subellipsoidea C-169]